MHKEFLKSMDYVCSELATGALWHTTQANEFRKIALRGFGRWADSEAIGDFKSRLCLEKLLRDNMDYSTIITVTMPDLHYHNFKNLPKILHEWVARENEFIENLLKITRQAAEVDIAIYRELIALTEETQGESTRVKLCGMRFELADFDGHDIGRANQIIHEYFEKHPECRKCDFNIG